MYQHQEFIEASKAGDRQAQYELYNLYVDAMYSTCFRMMSSQQDAEDVLQESFVSAFSKLEQFKYESTFGAWLKRIVVNTCLNAIRSKKAIFVDYDQVHHEQAIYDSAEAEQNLDLTKVKQGIAMLPDGYRYIINLYLIEGYDHIEIGEIMNISSGTSKSQYHRAKKKLIEILKTL